MVIAIDPGNKESAWLVYGDGHIIDFGIDQNETVLDEVLLNDVDALAIEMVASYGMPVGASVFETCVWIGRFIQRYHSLISNNWHLCYRKNIKLHLCNTVRAKDANVRQALIDRLGEPGTKKNPGITYGISKDVWSALAVAIYFTDTIQSA